MLKHTVAHRLWQNALADPEKEIITLLYNRQPDQAITFRNLMESSASYAKALDHAGIMPGEVVILILQHGDALIYAFFGAILHGAIPAIMPFLTEKLSPEQYRRSLAALFQVTAPAGVVTYPEFKGEVLQAMQESAKEKPPSVRAVLLHTEISSSGAFDEESLPGLQRSPEEVALLQHSSGTTGLQKGVALSHRAIFNQLHSYTKALNLTEQDVVVSWLPLYHDMGLIAGFLMPVLMGMPLVLLSPLDWVRAPYRLFQAVSRFKGTLTWLPNFAYNFCTQKVRERDLEGVDLSTWRAVINCSEPMYLNSHQIFLERFRTYGLKSNALATCYAMAENVFAVTQGGIGAAVTIDWIDQQAYFIERKAIPNRSGEPGLPMVSAGRPIENTQILIFDEYKNKLPDRLIGEIAIRSNCILSGYYNRPDATASAFHEGWYLTGDLGYQADGEIYITGRKKDLIIVGGKNIYPQDLENLSNEIPGVYPGRVVAFGVVNEESGTEDVVILAETDEVKISAQANEALANEIRQRVNRGSDIALRYVEIVPRGWLIKTSSGKIARGANKDKYLSAFRSSS